MPHTRILVRFRGARRGVGARAERERAMAASLGTVARWSLSWKVRYRTVPWFFIQMSKLYRALSLLYRRQILQVNIRWKALDEIYKIYMLLHRSDLNISENFRQTFSHFSAKFKYFAKIDLKFVFFEFFSVIFAQILMKFYRNFAYILENVEIKFFWIFWIF